MRTQPCLERTTRWTRSRDFSLGSWSECRLATLCSRDGSILGSFVEFDLQLWPEAIIWFYVFEVWQIMCGKLWTASQNDTRSYFCGHEVFVWCNSLEPLCPIQSLSLISSLSQSFPFCLSFFRSLSCILSSVSLALVEIFYHSPMSSPMSSSSFSVAFMLRWTISPSVPLFRTLHPELKEQLKELRKHLVESTNEMSPLKVWQMQGRLTSPLPPHFVCWCLCFGQI